MKSVALVGVVVVVVAVMAAAGLVEASAVSPKNAASGGKSAIDFVYNVGSKKVYLAKNANNLGEGLTCDVCVRAFFIISRCILLLTQWGSDTSSFFFFFQIQFAVEGINILLNYILDNVIIGDCGSLCGSLSKLGKIEGFVHDT